MGTVCPSLTLISFSTPAEGDGISASTLSVEISNNGSSRSTLSPGFLSHLVIVPSKMLSPICGMTTSVAILHSPVRHQTRCRARHAVPLKAPSSSAQVPSRHQKLFLRSAKNIPRAAANTAPAYPAPSRASAGHPDRRTPFRKESLQFRPRFLPFWCLHALPNIYWFSSPIAKSSLHRAAAASANQSLRLRCLPSPARPPLRATCASSPRRKQSSGACPRAARWPCRWAPCNPRLEPLL